MNSECLIFTAVVLNGSYWVIGLLFIFLCDNPTDDLITLHLQSTLLHLFPLLVWGDAYPNVPSPYLGNWHVVMLAQICHHLIWVNGIVVMVCPPTKTPKRCVFCANTYARLCNIMELLAVHMGHIKVHRSLWIKRKKISWVLKRRY